MPERTERSVGSSSEEPAPHRGAHGRTTRSAPHERSTQRPESSTLPPMVTRRARWAETTYEEACSTGLGATPEASCRGARPDTVLWIRSAPPHPKARLLGGTPPIADSGHYSEARWLLTGRAARECRHFRAVCVAHHLPTRPSPGIARGVSDPKVTIVDATPSEELTPSDHLAAVSRHLS